MPLNPGAWAPTRAAGPAGPRADVSRGAGGRAPRPARTPRARSAGAALAAVASLLAAGPAPAAKPSVKQACADAFVQTQRLRLAGDLVAARREAKACARDGCPAITSKECVRWAAELDRAIPSVLVRVRDAAGRESAEATVMLDGQPLEGLSSGLAAEVNPGAHVFEVALRSGASQRREIVLYEGEKARPIDVSFEPPAPLTPPPAPPEAPAPPARPAPRPGPPVLAYVLGGVGVAGVAGFAALGLSARAGFNDLDQRCRPSCPGSEVDALKRRALLADVSLGVGVVGLGAATYLFLRPREQPRTATALPLDVLALPGGAALTARGAF